MQRWVAEIAIKNNNPECQKEELRCQVFCERGDMGTRGASVAILTPPFCCAKIEGRDFIPSLDSLNTSRLLVVHVGLGEHRERAS